MPLPGFTQSHANIDKPTEVNEHNLTSVTDNTYDALNRLSDKVAALEARIAALEGV